MEIFCPNNHLMLESQACPKCGWKRPVEGEIGKLFWPPLELKTILGGVSRAGFAKFTKHKDNFLLPTSNNEILSVSLHDGRINGRIALPKGQRATDLTSFEERLFVTFQDTHSLIEGIKGGNISVLDEEEDQLNPVWNTSSHALTPPMFHDNRVYVRTAESKIYCLDGFSKTGPVWERECQSWWPAPLFVFADQVIYVDGNPMLDETEIIALDRTSGEVNWSYTIPSRPTFHLTGSDDYIVVIVKAKSMVVLDPKTGDEVFQQDLPRYYCRPVLTEDRLLYTSRGSKDDPNGYYQFHVYSLNKSEFLLQTALENRVSISPLLVDDIVYLADDKAVVHALSIGDGKEIWQIPGDEEDPIRTSLYCFDNQLVFGTYSGRVFSFTIRQPRPINLSPKELTKSGDFPEAAAAYALEGKWAEAAKLYSEKINDVEKALQLYEHGNLLEKAAQLSFDHNLYSRALGYYRSIDDKNGEAKTLLAMGDLESASKILYSLGDKIQAAELMEQAGKLSAAAQLYKETGRMVDYVRLIIKTNLDPSEVEVLRKAGNFEVAAEWQLQNRSYVEAAKDFKEAGLHEKELEAFKKYLFTPGVKPEPWIWQRIAELGQSFSDHLIEAKAWSKLDRPTESGEAYQKYAETIASGIIRGMEGISTPLHEEAANYYRLAAEAFHEAGISDREEHCKEMIRKYQLLPKVIILEVKTATGLREMEWNNLSLTIKNIGYGRARQVKFRLNEDYFHVEADNTDADFNLAPGLTRVQQIHIKPMREEIGDFVPLQIDWSWRDSTGKEYRDRFNNSVAVAKQREELPSQPIYFNVQNIEGDYVHQKGDRVDIIHGNSPLGDHQLSVTSNDGSVDKKSNFETPKIITDKPFKKCVSCNKEIPTAARVCPYCRTDQ